MTKYVEVAVAVDRLEVTPLLAHDDYLRRGVIDLLENEIPAAAVVEVRRGRWIAHRVGRWEMYWTCSACETMGSPEWKCCPVCTAFMAREVVLPSV